MGVWRGVFIWGEGDASVSIGVSEVDASLGDHDEFVAVASDQVVVRVDFELRSTGGIGGFDGDEDGVILPFEGFEDVGDGFSGPDGG